MDPDENIPEDDADEGNGTNLCAALGIGGTVMSKGELASLIRFGANAIYDGKEEDSQGQQISDKELDAMLERPGGRDASIVAPGVRRSSSGSHLVENGATPHSSDASSEVVGDPFERAQQSLRDRMGLLKEVDLRQLDDIIYRKKTAKENAASLDADSLNADLIGAVGKRVRKERIVMVDGRGTGYGGAVPMLSAQVEAAAAEEAEPEERVVSFRRGRQWHHISYCVLCGRKKSPSQIEAEKEEKKRKKRKRSRGSNGRRRSEPSLAAKEFPDPAVAVKCAHCPWVVHFDCAARYSLSTRGGGSAGIGGGTMFCCPHHKCCACYRSTAAAGGMLFRCVGCLTAYCEDCLPQDEVESVGRCRALEQLGYESKQSYYIRCTACVLVEKGVPSLKEPSEGIENGGEVSVTASETMEPVVEAAELNTSIEDETRVEEIEAEEVFVPSKTQLMRIAWNELEEVPEVEEIGEELEVEVGKGSKSSRKRRQSAEADSGEEGDTADIDMGELATYKPNLPEQLTALECISLIAKHPAFIRLLELLKATPVEDVAEDPSSINESEAQDAIDPDSEAMTVFNHALSKLEGGNTMLCIWLSNPSVSSRLLHHLPPSSLHAADIPFILSDWQVAIALRART